MPFPTLPPEQQATNIELDLMENEPGGLFPIGQDSYWGQLRLIFAQQLQGLADQLHQWYLNMNPATVDEIDMPMWEQLEQIPASADSKSVEQRRAFVISRSKRGAFTRTRRREVVEAFIAATLGLAPEFSPDGLPLTVDGLPFFADISSVIGTYAIVEDIPGFAYTVYILDTIDPDLIGLARELERITTAPITFSIEGYTNFLTMTGNEITDELRTSQGPVDGFAAGIGAGVGIWESHTNQAINTAFLTSINGWGANAGTVSLDTTTANPFPGHHWFKCVSAVPVTSIVGDVGSGVPAVAGQGWTFSCWVVGTAGKDVALELQGRNSANTAIYETLVAPAVTIAATGVPQRLTFSGTLADARTQSLLPIAAMVEAQTLLLTAPMLAQTLVDVPYVANTSETIASTATRAAARVQGAAKVFDAPVIDGTQFWFAFRLKPGWSVAQMDTAVLFNWATDDSNRITAQYVSGGSAWVTYQLVANVETGFADVTHSPVESVPEMVIMQVTATELMMSVNGSPFSAGARGGIYSPTGSMFDIGSYRSAIDWIDGSVLWAACGLDVLTDADAAVLSALGNTPPSAIADLPGNARMIWQGIDHTTITAI